MSWRSIIFIWSHPITNCSLHHSPNKNLEKIYRSYPRCHFVLARFFYYIELDSPQTRSHEHIFSNYRQPSHATNCARVPPCRSPTSLIGCEIILKNSIGPNGTGWSLTYYFAATDFEHPVKFLCERWKYLCTRATI